MDVKPSAGVKVKVSATREAVFGEDGVEVKTVSAPSGGASSGVLTGRTLVGFTEVEMAGLDGKKHWYPVEQMMTDKGERVVEEEVPVEMPSDDSGDEEDSEEEA